MVRAASFLAAVGLLLGVAATAALGDVERTVATILELADELKEKETRLCIVRMPVRPELYQASTDSFDSPLGERHANTESGDLAGRLLTEGGVPVINLYPDIRRESLLSDIYARDRFHFESEAEERIVAILDAKLKEAGLMLQPDDPKDVVFMGECFADNFAQKIIAADPVDSIKVLNKNGGGYLVHNYLFVFPDEYLEDTDLVVWIFTDRHFSNPAFAQLEPDPEILDDVEPRVVVAQVMETTQLKLGDEKLFDYPDALRAGVFEVEGTGERLVGIDQILKDRQITLARKYGPGDRLRLKLVPWHPWIRAHPKMVKLFMIDDVDDFTLPRYWIEDWLEAPAPAAPAE